MNLDIGEFPDSDLSGGGESDDPTRLTRLVAHAVARVGDRFTVVRKFSRHLEGADRRAGLLSDVSAALIELYKRNPEIVESLGKQAAQNFAAHREVRKAATTQPPTQTPPGGVVND